MTNQEVLIKLMEIKADYVDFPHLFIEEDKQEILSWSDETSQALVSHIRGLIRGDAVDSDICPWCLFIRYNSKYGDLDCSLCNYGDRHEICDDLGSDYQKAVEDICSFSLEEDLINELKKLLGIVDDD